jgi:hypothetical protein
MTEDSSPENLKKMKPWHMGLAIGFLMAIVSPFNTWVLRQLDLIDTWTGMLVALPIMCLAGLIMAVIWQRWL